MTTLPIVIEKLSALLNTPALTDWEHDFVTRIYKKTAHGKYTGLLTDPQIKKLREIHDEHYA